MILRLRFDKKGTPERVPKSSKLPTMLRIVKRLGGFIVIHARCMLPVFSTGKSVALTFHSYKWVIFYAYAPRHPRKPT